MALFFTTLLLARLGRSEPSISFPINSQLPPVARIGQLFSYSFSPYTFRSDTNITYSLGDHPEWLSIESEERRLFGTPEDGDVPPGDVVGVSVGIVATDDAGSVSLDATLVVSRNEAPDIKTPMLDQIEHFGPYSAPSSLLSYPSTTFEYTFDPDTFEDQGGLSYYAVSDDSSPLPAWMHFDTKSLTFSGTTPSFETLVQPPQMFSFELVASDVVGFSASAITFSIVVGSHKLTTDRPTINFNTTRGARLSYEGLEDGIQLDDKPVQPGDLEVSTDDLPGWLSFDKETWKIEGTPGKGDHSTNFTINFHDDFADTLSVLGVISVATSLFETTFPDLEVMPGDEFDLDLAPYFRDPDDIEVAIDAGSKNTWLKLNGLQISGRVPKSASGGIKVSIEAASKSTGLKETEILAVKFVDPKAKPTTSTSTSTSRSTSTKSAGSTATETGSDEDPATAGPGELGTGQILLATIIPILFIALIVMLLVCFFRRRRTNRTYLSSKYRHNISKPVLGSLRVNGSDPSIRHVENEKGGGFIETRMLHPVKGGYDEVNSRPSSGSQSDLGSLDLLSTPDLPPGFMGGGLGTSGSLTNDIGSSEGGRHSWFTVEGTSAQRSDGTRSHRSDTTFSGSTHQLLTTPSLAAFRSGLDPTIPSMEETFANMPPQPARYSTTTSSSEALPSSRHGSHRGGATRTRMQEPLQSNPASPLREQDEAASQVPELRAPSQARLSSQNWRRPGTAVGPGTESPLCQSSEESKSLRTDTSFGSSENWRVIGRPGKSYRDLVEEAPFHPRAAQVSSEQEWRREDSGKTSKGSEGSFKVFI